MDTKSKKWKPAVSFAAFVLGASLILGGAAEVLAYMGNTNGLGPLTETDYQKTGQFRWYISACLEDFVAMGTGSRPDVSGYYSNDYDDFGETYVAAQEGTVSDWGWGFAQGASDTATSESVTPKVSDEQWVKNAQTYYESDKNLIYSIYYKDKLQYTNHSGLTSISALPAGYNFGALFDGDHLSIIKDGKEFSAEEAYEYEDFWLGSKSGDVKIILAAKKTPEFYRMGLIRDNSNTRRQSRIYEITQDMQKRGEWFYAAVFMIVVGGVLFALYLLWRRDKQRADRVLAHWTGTVWFEIKALLLILLLILPVLGVLQLGQLFDVLRYGWKEVGWAWGELAGRLGDGFGGSIIPCFCIVYLCINDLRYGEKPWKHNLCGKLGDFFSAREMKLPLAKRMVKRYRNAGVGEIIVVFVAMAAGVGLYLSAWNYGFFVWDGANFLVSVILLAAAVAVIVMQLRAAKENRQTAGDLSALVDQIHAIRRGELAVPLALPTDADLAAAANDLNEIQSGLHEALDEQMKSERMKVELIANVSHDIKTPLTSIISYVELLKQEEDLPQHVQDYVKVLDRKSQRLKTMVQDVVEVSKAASGQLPVAGETLDFAKLLRQTLADMAERIEAAPVTVRTDIPEGPVSIYADGQRLYRVFQNLIQNALQYALAGSRVYVTLSLKDGAAVARVQNTSATELPEGMDFTERFVRGDMSRTDGGSGLGLSIASSFTEACGGRFRIETEADLFSANVEFPTA